MGVPSIRLIVAYFGRRPAYLPLVLRSMAGNPDVSWLLFTEAPVPDAPPNVTVEVCSFDHLVARIRGTFDFPITLDDPYKLCDYRPAFGEIFRDELAGYDFWGHSDVDVLFGRIRDHLPAEAFAADKILFAGNFALYRNTPAAATWYRHEVGRVSYRDAFAAPHATHFDEWAGIYWVLDDLGVPSWHENRIFDLSFARYRTRALTGDGRSPGDYVREPRRYAWENGEVCEYRVDGGAVLRRTALLVHFQKRTMRPPPLDVLRADRFWITANGFTVQGDVTPRTVRAARLPAGHEIVPHYWRRWRRSVRRRAARKAGLAPLG